MMEIWHRVTFDKEDQVDDLIESMGIKDIKTPIFHRYIITFEGIRVEPTLAENQATD
jgi:hypothetical protein